MVGDPKSQQFVKAFVAQWLDVDAMDRVEIDATVYKTFSNAAQRERYRAAIRREPVEFFAEICGAT